jgi:hypothetical protein
MKRTSLDTVGLICGALALLMVFGSLFLIVQNFQSSWLPFRVPDLVRIFQGEEGYEPGGNTLRDEAEERIETAVTDLDVGTVAGSVSISGWNENFTLVKWTKTAPSREALEKLAAKIEVRGGTLTAKREALNRLASRGTVSFEIYLAAGTKRIKAKSVSGSVRLTGMPGGVIQDLGTVSGAIETDNAAVLTAGSISGSINFSFKGTVLQVKSVSGSVRGEVQDLQEGGSVKIQSVSGSVHLACYSDLDAQVNLHSVSGSVSSELPVSVTQSRRNMLEGVIGRGSIPLEIGTTSGSIRITRLR